MKYRILAGAVVVTVGASLHAQSLAEIAAAEAARRAATAPATKTLTNKDLPSAPAGSAPPPLASAMAVVSSPAQQQAVSALRAVDSVVSGGANTIEFKKYYLDAKVKVDALPVAPENAVLREIAAIYGDAVTLFAAWQTERLSAEDARAMRLKYGGVPGMRFNSLFENVPTDGFQRESAMTRNELQRAALSAQFAGKALLTLAGSKLGALR